jgi:hypothetical protein
MPRLDNILDSTPSVYFDIDTPDGSVNHTVDCTADCTLEKSQNINSIQDLLKRVGYNEEDIDSALSSQTSIENDENSFGRCRPTTHVFSQGKVFTYPKLEIPIQQKSRKIKLSAIQSIPVIHPEVNPFIPSKPTNHTILTSLRNIRIANLKNVIIGQLNINSLRNKFHALIEIIHGNIDILIITESKLDHTFPQNQFHIPGYSYLIGGTEMDMGVE